jgi:predicted amidohydrolase YtcJ
MALLKKAGIDLDDLPQGIQTDDTGKPDGTLIEMAGIMAVMPALPDFFNNIEEKISHIIPLFTAGGHTTVCEASLGAFDLDLSLGIFNSLFAKKNISLRMVGLPWAQAVIHANGSLEDFIKQVKKAASNQSDQFRIGAVKLYTDGSLISKTAPLSWPGYWNGTPRGEMAFPPQTIHDWIVALHKEGIPTVTHTNTDLGCQIVLDAVKEAQSICNRPDIRHRMDHCYTITEAQLKQAKALGVTVQFFTPQLYYYGESHMELLGPNRSHHLTPIGTARRIGVSWGFHNDPPGSPQLPWVGAHSVINRLTCETNTLLGPEHRVSIQEALKAMTIEAAFQMHMDHEIGSIEVGKKADFCVLEKDPFKMDPLDIKDMPVWGTVYGGVPQKAK